MLKTEFPAALRLRGIYTCWVFRKTVNFSLVAQTSQMWNTLWPGFTRLNEKLSKVMIADELKYQ
jgi:hypothetical protein